MELRDIRLKFLQENRQKVYRKMSDDGTLEEHLETRARLAHEAHDRILRQGHTVIDDQAWSWAIREVLLESPWD